MRYCKEKGTYLLVCDGICCIAHQLLNMLYTAHLGVDLLENLCALLQPKQYILLYLRKLDVRRKLLQLFQLRIRLFK